MPSFTFVGDEERVYLFPSAFIATPGEDYDLPAAPDHRFVGAKTKKAAAVKAEATDTTEQE